MTEAIEIQPVEGPVKARVRPPGSKSITNRALVCAALADGVSTLSGALVSDDTRVMIDSLNAIGVGVSERRGGTELVVNGCAGAVPALETDLYIGNSGTTVRFLTAMLTLGRGEYRLDGTQRMQERPIQDLVDALNALGADVSCEQNNGCPPVWVKAKGLPGGKAAVRGDISSQFLSGLLMAAPCAAAETTLAVEGELVSKPYVAMTTAVMSAFGVEVEVAEESQTFLAPAAVSYRAAMYDIEPDASAASYFWALAAITGGEVAVEGLTRDSLQGDVAFVECLQKMGCDVAYHPGATIVSGGELRGAKLDMNAISDTVQTLAAVALFAQGPTEIRGVAHNRHKETDRIGDLATELRKLGAKVDEFDDGLKITPRELHGAEIETYDDHRMAMSLALVGLRVPGVRVANPGCTAKTYPGYFEDLATACGGK
ncbi:3-phosphoshikimate 1-carboxyvinyltransferase [Pseudobythopirellula maris]|uniref:3-phosphoshikimate 1-carboxyvinyltransferase n=1 Tax=Pseudobythopirellula maris TaxID=2527991 RepID=A0A5C5ZSS0_9BACT|nr:3-phosphoshikimate 1-carboxyvinyltransferase [Pseudobythopirellula maris]TWT90037.1 3-phosphoshikimate 1-carboxyvinyltransferase [Pseudobythopirellula maris]